MSNSTFEVESDNISDKSLSITDYSPNHKDIIDNNSAE